MESKNITSLQITDEVSINLVTRFQCPICQKEYDEKVDAVQCAAIGMETTDLKAGDIVVLKGWKLYPRFGWFDGDPDWIAYTSTKEDNAKQKTEKAYSFYYVLTSVEKDNYKLSTYANPHSLRFHLTTLAMQTGYSEGHTAQQGHYAIVRATDEGFKPPQAVLDAAKKLVGKKFKHLL